MGHLFGLKLHKDISRIYSMYKITMASTPQLPFDIISNILQIRMENKKDDRYKNNFNAVVKNINDINVVRDCIAYFYVNYPNDFVHNSKSRAFLETPKFHNGVYMLEKIRKN